MLQAVRQLWAVRHLPPDDSRLRDGDASEEQRVPRRVLQMSAMPTEVRANRNKHEGFALIFESSRSFNYFSLAGSTQATAFTSAKVEFCASTTLKNRTSSCRYSAATAARRTCANSPPRTCRPTTHSSGKTKDLTDSTVTVETFSNAFL